jgi:hypothetical protein
MNLTRNAFAGILLAGVAAAPTASAAPLQCGTEIIEVGMTMIEVRQHCGEPSRQESEEQDVRSGNRVVGTTTFHRWYYARGGVTHVMTFDQDRLVEID